MKNYLILAAFIVFCLYSAGLVFVGYKAKKCPEPPPVDTHREDSIRDVASHWEGKAKAYREERDALKKLRDNYLRTRPSTSSAINRNTNAIRSSGFNAAVDTNDRRPD